MILFLLHRNIHSYLVFKIFQNVFSKAENIVFFITMLAYFEKDGITPEQELAFADFKENKQMVSVREGELIVELGPVPRVCGNEACGQPIPMDNIAFCPHCGARVS